MIRHAVRSHRARPVAPHASGPKRQLEHCSRTSDRAKRRSDPRPPEDRQATVNPRHRNAHGSGLPLHTSGKSALSARVSSRRHVYRPHGQNECVTPEDFFVDEEWTGRRTLDSELLQRIRSGVSGSNSDVEAGVGLLRLAHDELEAYGTDGEQRTSEDEIRLILRVSRSLLKRMGIALNLPFSDFRTFRSHWLANGAYGSWRARREILHDLFGPIHRELEQREDDEIESTIARPIAGGNLATQNGPARAGIASGRTLAADAATDLARDVFISHATEDKADIARPLAEALRRRGISVWYDDFELRLGDSLRQRIDAGIARSRFGLVILSEAFFAKGWPLYELAGFVAQMNSGQKSLLPIWHDVSRDDVLAHSPSLADIVALSTSGRTTDEIADEVAAVVAGEAVPTVREDAQRRTPEPMQAPSDGVNAVTLTAGPVHHYFTGVTVSPHSDIHGRHFLDVRKNDISSDDYVRLCNEMASGLGAGSWRARLDIGGTALDFDSCEVTPKDTARNNYLDVRVHTDASGYRNVMEALAASAKRHTD